MAMWRQGRGVVWRVGFAAIAASAAFIGGAEATCGLCAKSVTTNSALARCFLDRHDEYAARDGAAIAVDLGECGTEESERGVVEALSSPVNGTVDPDIRFIVSRAQLACLKQRLEDGAANLDPFATIPLDDCE